jgi:CRP-like cAMP-binding protein
VDDIVRKAPLFTALDDEAAASLQAMMQPVRLARGEVLFAEGDQGDRLYVISEGKIKLGRTSSDGRENLLAILGPGEMFGELSLFDPGPRTATATSVGDSALIGLSNDALPAWLLQHPEVAAQLLRALARRLRRFGRRTSEGILVAHELTQEELAQLVGASRETVNKALADFAARGWLRLEPRSVLLIEPDRLRHRSR